MKNSAKKLAAYYGCETKYSGNNKTLYVIGDESIEATVAIKALKPSFNVVHQ